MDVVAAVASPVRRRILELTWHAERAAGEVAADLRAREGVTFGAVSQHLAVLRDLGLVDVRRDGRRRLYRARRAGFTPALAAWLESTWTDKLAALKHAAEAEEAASRAEPRPRARRRPAPAARSASTTTPASSRKGTR